MWVGGYGDVTGGDSCLEWSQTVFVSHFILLRFAIAYLYEILIFVTALGHGQRADSYLLHLDEYSTGI